MLQSIFENTTGDVTFTIENCLISLAVAIVLGIVISILYMKTNKNKFMVESFSYTLVLMPAIITVIILLVGNSVARAFSLAGAFSIVRFRNTLGDTKDMAYILLTMALGLACGMGYVAYAVLFAVILCILMVVLEVFKFGKVKIIPKILKIVIPESLDYQNAFDGVLKKYTEYYLLTKVKTIDLGSLYQLTYEVTTKENINEKEFIDELRCRNGNLNITLVLNSTEREMSA